MRGTYRTRDASLDGQQRSNLVASFVIRSYQIRRDKGGRGAKETPRREAESSRDIFISRRVLRGRSLCAHARASAYSIENFAKVAPKGTSFFQVTLSTGSVARRWKSTSDGSEAVTQRSLDEKFNRRLGCGGVKELVAA